MPQVEFRHGYTKDREAAIDLYSRWKAGAWGTRYGNFSHKTLRALARGACVPTATRSFTHLEKIACIARRDYSSWRASANTQGALGQKQKVKILGGRPHGCV